MHIYSVNNKYLNIKGNKMLTKINAVLILLLPMCLYSQSDLKNLEILPNHIQNALEERERAIESYLPPEIQEQIFSSVVEKSRIWNEGALKVSFKGGSHSLHRLIAETANIWTKYGEITFDFGYDPIKETFRTWSPHDSSHIRVGFDYKGYWPLVGNISVDWSLIPKGQISLNLEEFNKGVLPSDWKAIVLHEFGHALGFKHEHQSPDGDCDFDWPKVYSELAKEPNKWDEKKVDHNLRKLKERGLMFSDYDKESIMHYSLPAWMFKSGTKSKCYTEKNVELSGMDKKMMSTIYPVKQSEFSSQRNKISMLYEQILLPYINSDSISSESKSTAYEIFGTKAAYFSTEKNENSKYIVGIQGLNIDDIKYYELSQYIMKSGYSINLNSNYKEPRPWLANFSIVLYYTQKNKNKAKELASELSKITGIKFEIGIGNGLAVFDPEKQFYVHYIQSN